MFRMFPLKHSAPSTSWVKLSDKSHCEEEASTSVWRESSWFYLVIDERREDVTRRGGRKSTQGRQFNKGMFLFFLSVWHTQLHWIFLGHLNIEFDVSMLAGEEARLWCKIDRTVQTYGGENVQYLKLFVQFSSLGTF